MPTAHFGAPGYRGNKPGYPDCFPTEAFRSSTAYSRPFCCLTMANTVAVLDRSVRELFGFVILRCFFGSAKKQNMWHIRSLLAIVLLAVCLIAREDVSAKQWGKDTSSSKIIPFRVNVSDLVLDDVLARVRATRFPSHALPEASAHQLKRSYGTTMTFMQDIVEFWHTSYDWRSFEAELNELPHFTTVIDGLSIHFLHFQSTAKDAGAIPLMFVHGWPGSFAECLKIAPLLIDRFNLVCPSIPGYGFSGHPSEEGFDQLEAARIFIKLMRLVGYPRYALQGGDWGSTVTTLMADEDAANVIGLHLNFITVPPPLNPASKGLWTAAKTAVTMLLSRWLLTEEENAELQRMTKETIDETGYMHQQGTRPLTLGFALSDSPVGLAAWIIEKYARWSDCNGDVLTRFSKSELLNYVMLYWVNNAITPSMRFYYEFFHSANALVWDRLPKIYISVPTAYAKFPKEIFASPRVFAETAFNIQRWTIMPRGGHFAALEEPQLLADDIRQFFLVDLGA